MPKSADRYIPTRRFADRTDAGKRLAGQLTTYADRSDVHILGLPRGGVATAAAVADTLHAPLDVFVVRKLGVPWHPELAMGAVASGGVRVLNDEVVQQLGIGPDEVDEVTRAELAELNRREQAYRADAPRPTLAGQVVVLVDDGLATGATARAAVAAVRKFHPSHVVLAVPVAPHDVVTAIRHDPRCGPDELAYVLAPRSFDAVGYWYEDFSPTSDEEVSALLQRARGRHDAAPDP